MTTPDTEKRNLGEYELLEVIGRGGMAIVYRARQPRVDRDVAVKVIIPPFSNHPLLVKRFEEEARAVARHLEFHKIRWPGGVRLWRVTGPGVDLGAKQPYDPQAARQQSHEHAKHFASLLDRIAQGQGEHHGDVIVAPFDTELFGHWWYEGPDFLGDMYANLPNYPSVRATRAHEHVDRASVFPVLRLGNGSWGKDGDFSMWMGAQTWWTWPAIWELEDAFWSVAPRAIGNPASHPILAQAARSLLLVQSSDWQFIISTGEVDDYAIKRFNGHVNDCKQLLDVLGSAVNGERIEEGIQLAAAQQQRDDIFPDIIPSIETALIGATIAARM